MVVLEFLKTNYMLVLACLSIFIEFLILVLKKKPKTLDNFIEILHEVASNSLPSAINCVECVGNGESKKREVLEMVQEVVIRKLGRHLSSKEEKIFNDFFSKQIELILSTPQKKEN